MTKKIPTVHVRTRAEWRAWLQANHDSVAEIWLLFDKKHTGQAAVPYEDSIEEALCFGWVDSLIRRIDDTRYARKFTPRKPDSKWSSINCRRYARMKAQGLLTEAGRQRPPTAKIVDSPPRPPRGQDVPDYLAKALKKHRAAWTTFETLAPSHRWHYVMWIDQAKRPETRERRLQQAIAMLTRGEKLGLK
jgi:uncharacterized protein YdeI (YjbR/CyaY-like superfamily)